MFLRLFILSVCVSATLSFANENDTSKAEILTMFLNQISELKIKNLNDTEQLQRPVAPAFAESLLESTRIDAKCTYRAKTFIQDCTITVFEGAEGEGLRGVTRMYTFTAVKGIITSKAIEVMGAI